MRISNTKLQLNVAEFRRTGSVTKDWTLHSLRHSFNYHYLKKGVPMYQLQAALGHKTIGITIDLYGQLQAEDIDMVSPYDDI